MKIATFNINGIKARLPRLIEWLEETQPDVACLQELKSSDETMPTKEIEAAGYGFLYHGQKGFNGVAILAKGTQPVETQRGLAGEDEDEQSRYLEADVHGIRVASIYLPNGNPIRTEKFDFKMRWMARLNAHARDLLALEEPFTLCGDYNVIPLPDDAKTPSAWVNDALFQPESRAAFRALNNLGLSEAGALGKQPPGTFTFWDYQAGAWQRNNGIRIDHLLLSPQAADRLAGVSIAKHVRGWEKASDHVPVLIELN